MAYREPCHGARNSDTVLTIIRLLQLLQSWPTRLGSQPSQHSAVSQSNLTGYYSKHLRPNLHWTCAL
jgi:hypothetical protein